MSLQFERGEYGAGSPHFESVEDANLQVDNPLFRTTLEEELERKRVAVISSSIKDQDFMDLAESFEICREMCQPLLDASFHPVDKRFGNEAGYVRKERKISLGTGMQIQDPKHLFHFNEDARVAWNKQFRLAPVELREFFEQGYALQDQLLALGKVAIGELEGTHPGITEAYFPTDASSVSFMRLVDYDDYEVEPGMEHLPVAKAHYDIGGYTIQSKATAPGFWGETPDGKEYFDDQIGSAYFFAGTYHQKIYGDKSRIQRLRHGVDRIFSPDATYVPRRKAFILFMDPWKIDAGITAQDTEAY